MRNVVLAVIMGALAALVPHSSDSGAAAAFQCADGQVLSSDGLTCTTPEPEPVGCDDGQVLDVDGVTCIAAEPVSESGCPEGQILNETGTNCYTPSAPEQSQGPCPEGSRLSADGMRCSESPDSGTVAALDAGLNCDPGYSVGADGETCIVDGPRCGDSEIVGDDGECVRTFQCSDGMVLSSDLLSCTSSGCPENEVLSVDGKRCIAADTMCPDGSPRPAGGACLVVETVTANNGETRVVVRCDEADVFCQSLIKDCAERRAAGQSDTGESCEDPRAACDPGDPSCAEANQRLVDCATRGRDDGGSARLDPCNDLCPDLHRLDESGQCVEYLDPTHPCVSWGRVPSHVTTNAQLADYSYLAGLGQCVTRAEFYRRLANFEAAAGAEADALKLLRETTSQYLTVEDQLHELEAQLNLAEADIERYTEEAAEADTKRIENERFLDETRADLDEQVDLLRDEVVEVYIAGDREQLEEIAVLRAANLSEVALARVYGAAVLDDQFDNVERIVGLESDAVTYGVELEAAAAQVEEALQAAIATNNAVADLLAETEELRAQQVERRNVEAELVAELRQDKAAYARELGVFEQASRQIADIISESEYIVEAQAEGDSLFSNPVIPAEVVSGFGPRLHPILGYVRNHNGLDFDANFGDSIYATRAGVVQIATSFGGYGKTVVIDHGGGNLTLYAHMSAILVEPGEQVEQDTLIGNIGSTGLSTGPHLHFEIWVDGAIAVDPIPYLTEL